MEKIRTKKKRMLWFGVIVFLLIFGVKFGNDSIVHAAASVDVGQFKVTGGVFGTDYSYQDNVLTIKTGTSLTIENNENGAESWDDTFYADRDSILIEKDVCANLTLKNLTIWIEDESVGDSSALKIADDSSGEVTITLLGENDLQGRNAPAIEKNGTTGKLTIQGTGSLNASVEDSSTDGAGAGIGSAANQDTANIYIKSGTITATGGKKGGAGIGGGYAGAVSNIVIGGGTITANGWTGGAGIGGGFNRSGSDITINDGVIKATSYVAANDYNVSAGAGIGGGAATTNDNTFVSADGINITINGGTVTATGGNLVTNQMGGAGIGGGSRGHAVNVQINGGTITANGGAFAAGIGAGGAHYEDSTNRKLTPDTKKENTIFINGGDITATGNNTGAGIGGGYGRAAKVTIKGGHILRATGGTGENNKYLGGAGIGGGGYKVEETTRYYRSDYSSENSTITILGGTIDSAVGGYGAAGIGEVYKRDNTVYIAGGSVRATAGSAFGDETATGDAVGAGAGATGTVVKSATDDTSLVQHEISGGTSGEKVNFSVKDNDGNDYAYGAIDVYADSQGKIYPYLPKGASVTLVDSTVWNGSFSVVPMQGSNIITDADIQTIALYQQGESKYTTNTKSDGKFVFATGSYEIGTYNIYADGKDTGETVTIGVISNNGEVTLPYYAVTYIVLPEGTGEFVASKQSVVSGGDYTFTVSPKDKYRVKVVLCISGSGQSELEPNEDGVYTVSNVKEAITLRAVFEEDIKEIDLSGVTWNYSTPFYFDNKQHTVALQNVPEHVTVTYSNAAATAVGEYTATATITPENGYTVKGTVSNCKWKIAYYEPTDLSICYADPVTEEVSTTKKDSYKNPVRVYDSNNKYTVCDSIDGTYTLYYEFTDTATKTLYFKQNTNGYITEGKEISITIEQPDTTPPELSIAIDGQKYTTIQTSATFKRYKLNSLTASLTATDNAGDVTVEYAVSGTAYTSEAKLKAANLQWTKGTSCTITANTNQVVYGKATDEAGKVTYASSAAIYADTKAPGISDMTISLASAESTDSVDVSFKLNESGSYYYAVLPAESNPTKEDIYKNGGSGNATAGNVISHTVTGLSAATEYRLFVYANDNVTSITGATAGNESDIVKSTGSVTTAKEKLTVDTSNKPVLSGTYGTSVGNMKITGGTVKCGTNTVTGTWKVTDDNAADVPNVGGTKQYMLTFTPANTTLYDAITYSVTPRVTAKSLTESMIGSIAKGTYTGDEIKPEVTLTDGSNALTKDVDYTVTYEDNINAGNAAKVKVTGKNNYTGTVTKSFTIAKATLASIDKPVYVNVTAGTGSVTSDLTELLPAMSAEDAKKITYSATVTGTENVVSGTPTIKDDQITITLNKNATAGSSQTITVTMASDNYNDMTAKLIVQVTAKTVVTLEDSVEAENSVYDGSAKTGYTGTIAWKAESGSVSIPSSDVTITYSGTTVDGKTYGPTTSKPTDAGNYKVSFTVSDNNANYSGNKILAFEIEKQTIDVSGVALKQKYYTYKNEEITAKVDTETIPKNVNYTITGNQETDAGSYNAVIAFTVTNSNYEQPQSVTRPWYITKAEYDITGITWNYSEAFTYDGTRKTVELKGVPDALEVEYVNNSQINVGTYTASATLSFKNTSDKNNYTLSDIGDLNWEIKKRADDVTELSLSGVTAKDSVYQKGVHPTGYVGTPTWKDGQETVAGVETTIVYSGTTFNGDTYETSKTAPTNAGNYEVTFTVTGTGYTGSKTMEYTIEKASYDMKAVGWNYSGTPFTEDGTTHSVTLVSLPEGVIATYSGNEASKVGTYEASVKFAVKDTNNYKVPDTVENCDWKITQLSETDKTKTRVELSGVTGKDMTYGDSSSNKGYSGNVTWKANGSQVSISDYAVSYYGKANDGTTYGPSTTAPVKAGSYVVTFTVNNSSYIGTGSVTYTILRKDYDMSNVHWNYSGAFTYTGSVHTVSLTGVPKGVTVSYTGNTATEVGVYTAQAEYGVADSDSYNVPEEIEPLEYEITKATISLANVTWSYTGTPYTYDGTEKSVQLQGVPSTVEVTYTGEKETDKGTYTAKAYITAKDTKNYTVAVSQMSCQWSIIGADDICIVLSDEVVAVSGIVYDESPKAGYTGTIAWYEKGTTNKVEGVTTKTQYNGVNGTVYSSSTAPTNAGSYTVTFTIASQDGMYAEPKTIAFTIGKADYDMTRAKWDYSGTPFEYDGTVKTVKVTGLPEGVSATYKNHSKTGAGVYTATVEFVVKDSVNYNIPMLDACKWEIKEKAVDSDKKDCDMSSVKWNYTEAFTYDGTAKKVEVTGLPEGVSVTYTDNEKTEIGTYTATATFAVKDTETYNVPAPMTCEWKIVPAADSDKKDYDMSSVQWTYKEPFTYDGTVKKVEVTGLPEGVSVTYTDNEKTEVGTYTATATFTVKDTDIYNVPKQITCEWKIVKSKNPGETTNPGSTENTNDAPQPEIGETVTEGTSIYKVTGVSAGKKTATYAGSTDKKITSATIPATITIQGESYNVTAIDKNAFKNCKKLKKVKLGANITEIGDNAFYKCTALTSIVIPQKVTTIGKQAFFGAKKLKTITIKSKVLKKVGNKAIKGIHKKAVIKCPNKKLAVQYKKKLFKSKTGYVKTMKIK